MIEKFIVLDVEGGSACRPYNVGYIIADRNGKIYKKHSFAFPECFWENIVTSLNNTTVKEMTCKNIQEICKQQGVKKTKRKYKNISIDNFFNFFTKEIKRYKIKKLYAYNVAFDKGSLNRLFGERLNESNLEYRDIMTGIFHTKLLTKRYIDFCLKNEYVTDKGNFKYSAEIVYRFLTGDKTFNEEHTGLADVLIEFDILKYVIKNHKKVDYSKNPCIWRELKKFAESKEYI